MFDPESLAATDDIELVATSKRIRARLGAAYVADTTGAVVLRRRGAPPEYLLPWQDVDRDAFLEGDAGERPRLGNGAWYDLHVGDRRVSRAALGIRKPVDGLELLTDYVYLKFGAVDAWLEEDEEIDVHPRDPRHRIDVRPSSREVTVRVAGEVVAHSKRPTMLFETGLKPRFYMPRTDLRWETLEPSETTTGCPYKGWATYHHIRVGDTLVEDVVWTYRYPRPGAIRVANLMCVYGEKTDEFEVTVR